MSAADRWQKMTIGDGEIICGANEQPPSRCEALVIAKHRFSLFALREQLGEPRGGGNEFDGDADESAATEQQERERRRCISGGTCARAIKQDAPKQDPAAAQQVYKIAAEQSENTAGDGRDIKKYADP